MDIGFTTPEKFVENAFTFDGGNAPPWSSTMILNLEPDLGAPTV